jgi:biopolymer transport protein ExbD
MARYKRPDTTPIDLNLAPMVDVMMCLLIFFMLATKMVEREHTAVDLPSAARAREPDPTEMGRRVVINVLSGGAENEDAVYRVGDHSVSLADLEKRLAAERARNPEVRCLIRADKELPYSTIESVMLICARAGVSRLLFGAVQDVGGGDA